MKNPEFYQMWNEEKNRWQKFNSKGVLQGTKKTEGPYVNVLTKAEYDFLTENHGAKTETESENIPVEDLKLVKGSTEATETENTTGEALKSEKATGEDSESPIETVAKEEKAPKEKVSKPAIAKPNKKNSEEAVPCKSLHEWLAERKVELITDDAFRANSIEMKTIISEKTFDEHILKCAVKNIN
jgi:hypothetical protein